ncbi:MAG: histone deacetylase [Acidobacteria bacterium]|nr:histone deacetylase [Acidobacteriota bacterium]
MLDWFRGLRLRVAHVPVWYDPEYRLPLSAFGKRTGLDPRRADLVAWYLLEHRWLRRRAFHTPARVGYEDLARVHSADYLEALGQRETLARVFGVDPWDVSVDELMRTVRLGCGGTVAAARESLRRRGPTLNLLGGFHHAGPDWGAGLCAVNDVAVAVGVLRHEGFGGQVVVLDFDAHPPDGTAACLRHDPSVWIGSLSGSSSGNIPGVDETVLPPRCDDERYLQALDAMMERMPAPDFALVIAGGDVLDGDHLGHLGMTLDGARRRDLRVARALAGVPTVWLPGGGYHADAWKVLAGTALALTGRTRRAIAPTDDPLATRFMRLARHLDHYAVAPSQSLSADDIDLDLGVRPSGPTVLFGRYTAEAIEYAFFRLGITAFLDRRGYRPLRVVLGASTTGQRVSVLGAADGREHVLIDGVYERKRVGEHEVLYIHWLSLRDPRARFSDRRPRLPGQEVPGLGLAREVSEMLALMARRLDLPGIAFSPAWYHTAVIAGTRLRFLDPARHGRFEAMQRDLAGVPLAEASQAVADGRVLMNGEAYAWEAEPMVSWEPSSAEREVIAAEREAVRFQLISPGPA